MLAIILAYIGGILTIFSPCILPVVPFIFARAGQPFRTSGLPLLIGMSLSFALFATLSVAGGLWVVQANQWGRGVALTAVALLGVSLLSRRVNQLLAFPFTWLGAKVHNQIGAKSSVAASTLIGASIGLLWAPCAGPILGLLLAGASLGQSWTKTFTLLWAFALGSATALSVGALASRNVLQFIKRGLGAEERLRKAIGVVAVVAAVAIATGMDTKVLAALNYSGTEALEKQLITLTEHGPEQAKLSKEGPAPELTGATAWLNTNKPLTLNALRGKVVLVDFWTYSCINCLRSLPHVKAWAEQYGEQGLVVIGVHTPEFAFERDVGNVNRALRDLNVAYPVAVDNGLAIWSAFHNQYWPAHYLIDATGSIRYHHFGEGSYSETEEAIKTLLQEANLPAMPKGQPKHAAADKAAAAEAAPSLAATVSPETYVGYRRQEGFVGNIVPDAPESYRSPASLSLDQWGLTGTWQVGAEHATLVAPGGSVSFRFNGRDLHLVIGSQNAKAIPFRVTIDGKEPQGDHGADAADDGHGVVQGHRLYQLIRQQQPDGPHTFRIEFLAPGAEVYAFTFG